MRTVLVRFAVAALVGSVGAAVGGCGGGVDGAPDDGRSQVVVTTSILGDVIANVVGADAAVDVLMPPGTDPHDFAPSARQAAQMREADVLVVNGLGFEVGLLDTIEAARADGVRVIEATDWLPGMGPDPHFFTDPVEMKRALNGIGTELANLVEELDTPAFRERVLDYQQQLVALSDEIEAILAPVPEGRRVLVTNHEVFGAFADRYGFDVLGSVIPGGSTLAEPSAAALHALAGQIAEAGVPAIFAETSAPARLAETLAAEGAGVRVVELYTESLGPPGSDGTTYIAMMRTNATRIAGALS